MIYDTLENLNQYTGLFPNLDKAIAYIEECELKDLPLGRTEIDADDVYVVVQEVDTVLDADKPFKTHSTYMELHVDLEGIELCEVSLGIVQAKTPYDAQTDEALWQGALSAALVMGDDRFAVFMIEEPHKTDIQAQGCDHVKKAVFKIRY